MAKLLLASKSPRRKELLEKMGLEFEIVSRDVDETFPDGLSPIEAVSFIAEKKAKAFTDLSQTDIILAADTIVTLDEQVIGKPNDEQDATSILQLLSGRIHHVITACALLHKGQLQCFHEVTEVKFRKLEIDEITYYIRHYHPFDKAGAYGIQEWIGMVGITGIAGSYNNVVGLPTTSLYGALKRFNIKLR